jgi:hypothetical protein
MPEGTRPSPAAKERIFLLGAILFLASAYFYQDPEWNGNSRLDLTRAVVEQGTLTIDQYQSLPEWETGDKAFYGGHFYTDKAIGSSLFAIPVYFILLKLGSLFEIALGSAFVKHVLTTTIQGGAFAATGLAMYGVAERLTQNPWKALVPTLALAFGTMLWPYSAVYYGHVLAAALLAVAFWLLFRMSEDLGEVSPPGLFAVGLVVGLAFITDYTTAPIIAGLLVFSIYAFRSRGFAGIRHLGLFAAVGAALPVALALAYNARVYGSAFATGYAYEVENRFAEGMSQGILGIGQPTLTTIYHITLDPQFGILWQSPIVLMAPIGYLVALSSARFRAAAVLSLYAGLAMLLLNGGYYLWCGGSAFGPRLMIPALPFLIVPVAVLSDALIWPIGVLGIVSSAQMLIPLMGQIQPYLLAYRPHRGMFFVANAPFNGFSLLYNYGIPQIAKQYRSGQAAWTLGAALGIPYVLSLPALIMAQALLILRFRRQARSGTGNKGSRLAPGPPERTDAQAASGRPSRN